MNFCRSGQRATPHAVRLEGAGASPSHRPTVYIPVVEQRYFGADVTVLLERITFAKLSARSLPTDGAMIGGGDRVAAGQDVERFS